VWQVQPVMASTWSLPSKRQPSIATTSPPAISILPLQSVGFLSSMPSTTRNVHTGGSERLKANANAAAKIRAVSANFDTRLRKTDMAALRLASGEFFGFARPLDCGGLTPLWFPFFAEQQLDVKTKAASKRRSPNRRRMSQLSND